MYRGELVEEGPVRRIFTNPRHPYTRGLLDCLPTLGSDKRQAPLVPIAGQVESALVRAPGCGFAGRCAHVEIGRCTSRPIPSATVREEPDHHVACVRADELSRWTRRSGADIAHEAGAPGEPMVAVHHLTKTYEPRRRGLRGSRAPVRAVSDVDLAAARGRTLAIVGESGCGKSTIAKVLSGLEVATAGGVTLDGVEVGALAVDARSPALKRKLQMVFQTPDSTLNPSHTVAYAIGRALRRLQGRAPGDLTGGVARLLEVVKLSPAMAARKPRHLSGGEKQRAAIARALARDPDVVVAAEPVSALDVSVQAAIVNLLTEIQAAHGPTLAFISHRLAVLRYLADTVSVRDL